MHQEDIAKLLRFESSALPAGQQTSLMDYASRMKAGTRNIYYLCAPNRHLAEHSPYFEAMKMKDMEVSPKSSRSEDVSGLNKIMVGTVGKNVHPSFTVFTILQYLYSLLYIYSHVKK